MNAGSSSMSTAYKSLTPQRKHRKLLKDGSGSEVWPEAIEQVFVDGLRQYLDSPWAAHARGRSRWRNQYLVDFLAKAGITRSKKQVASHLQVLRSMWRGQPEYYLVAGGDELLRDTVPISPVKSEELDSPSSLVTFDFSDEAETMSSNSSPNFSPPDLTCEIPPSPLFKMEPYSPSTGLGFSNDLPAMNDGTYSAPPGTIPAPLTEAVSHPSYSKQHLPRSSRTPIPKQIVYPPQASSSNRVTLFSLQADGMMPFGVTLSALSPPGSPPARLLKIRLSLPPMDDNRTPPTLHGFSGTIAIANVWTTSAKCNTKVYMNGLQRGLESAAVEPTSIDIGTVHAVLPESPLSRCRWLDSDVETIIHQDIVVDNEILLSVIYHLDRRTSSGPSALLLGYQANRVEKTSSPSSLPHGPTILPSHYGHYNRPSSLSYALTPIIDTRQGQARQ